MTARSVGTLIRQRRRFVIIVLAAVVVGAAIFWYFGTDVWHAVLLAGVVTAVAAAVHVGTATEVTDASWHDLGLAKREGSRREVAELSWGMRGSYGRVSHPTFRRVQVLAERRLAAYDLDLYDPDDRPGVEQLLGAKACAVLAKRRYRRPPRLARVLRCLDALEAIDGPPYSTPSPDPSGVTGRRSSSER